MYYEIEREVSRNLDQVNISAEIKAALFRRRGMQHRRDMAKNMQGFFDTWYYR